MSASAGDLIQHETSEPPVQGLRVVDEPERSSGLFKVKQPAAGLPSRASYPVPPPALCSKASQMPREPINLKPRSFKNMLY